MATIQQLFMNTVYYELSHIRDYHALVNYISQHYDDANSVQSMWKLIKQHKHAFKHKQTYEKLLSVVKHYVKHQAQKSEGIKEFIDKHHVNWETAFIEMYKSKDPIYQMNFLSARNWLRLSIAVSQKPNDVDKILTRLWRAYIGRV